MPLAENEVHRESNRSVSFVGKLRAARARDTLEPQLGCIFRDWAARVCTGQLQRVERKRKRDSLAGSKPKHVELTVVDSERECITVADAKPVAETDCIGVGNAVAHPLADPHRESVTDTFADAVAHTVAHADADAVTNAVADSNTDAVADAEPHARPADRKPERSYVHEHRRAIRADVYGDRSWR
jgi:hypothetical protein